MLENLDLSSLGLMAAAAFVAATLLPAQSEAVFVGLLAAKSVDPFALFLTASLANTAGSIVNWWLGRLIARHGVEKLPARQGRPLCGALGRLGGPGLVALSFAKPAGPGYQRRRSSKEIIL